MKFEEALEVWKAKEVLYRQAKNAYEQAFAKALLASQQPSAEKRKAEAEVAAVRERKAFDAADIEARAAEELMVHLRGLAA